MAHAVVGEEEHDGVVGDTLPLESLHDLADLPVDVLDRLEVLRPVLAHLRVVRVVGRELDLLGVDAAGLHGLEGLQSALVAALAAAQLDLGEERLAAGATGPVRAVVQVRRVFEVVVRLALGECPVIAEAAVGDVVARPAQDRRDRLHVAGQPDLEISPPAAVIVRADGRLVHPRDQGRSRRRADRRGHERARELGAFQRHPVDVGRLGEGGLERPEMVGLVLGEDPHDVGPLGCGLGRCRKGRRDCKQAEWESHHRNIMAAASVSSQGGRRLRRARRRARRPSRPRNRPRRG